MAYTSASAFTAIENAAAWLGMAEGEKNIAVTAHCYDGLGSSSTTALRDSCSALISWARSNGVMVNIGEIALNAGNNGRTTFCSTFATAQAQWDDWNSFCLANSDVIVGWNWWGNSASD